MGEADGSSVVGHAVWDLVLSDEFLDDLAEFEVSFSGVNVVRLEAAFDIVKDAEVLTSFLNGNDVHESEWESVVSSYSVVNFDVGILVLADLNALSAGESKFKSVLEQNRERDAFTELVGAS